MITSPYNFVPISDKVVMPFWAQHVSHDVPFENGVSGVLNLKITAKSPIYVRNGVFFKDKNNAAEVNRFNAFQNKYFIPASSIKGMLRSVMEIMSFGRMANKVNDDRYSVRDFQNSDIYNIPDLSQTVICGWLKKVNGEYLLQDCGEPGRISHAAIDAEFKTNMSEFFKIKTNVGPNSKSAKFKYDKYPTITKGIKHFSGQKIILRYICDFNENGGESGKIVFTGQPGYRYFNDRKRPKAGWDGKHLEFVFFEKTTPFEKVPEEVIKNFFFAYYDHDKNQQKEDWKWRKTQLDKGETIPVFFRRHKTINTIKDMGLSFLYKITYEQSIVESIANTQKNASSYDLAETIFGYTEGSDALKGRVHIGHAFLENDVQPLGQKSEVLSGPKASYYPNYIEQDHKKGILGGKYATFMNSSAKINGWKRYPIRSNGVISNQGTANVSTQFMPLNERAEFSFAIQYHNLRKEELGALISAITFHNTEGIYHSIGMAKPLGYGKIALSVDVEESTKIGYLKAYETFMDYALNNSTPLWFQSPQIKELFSMAKGSPDTSVDNELKYMVLTNNYNEFVIAKGKGRHDPKHSLQRFSTIANNIVNVTSLTNQADIVKAKALFQEEIKVLAQAQNKEELESLTKAKYEAAFKKRFEEKKNELLAFLEAKKQARKAQEMAISEAERLKKKEDKNTEGGQADLVFNSFDFEKIADVVKNHLKKYKTELLTDKQKEHLTAALTTSYQSIKNPKKDVWLKKDNKFAQFPWTDIKKWLGEEKALALHGALVRK